MSVEKPPKKIVILGTGFGGVYTYLGLKRTAARGTLSITLVNKTNYFLFTPLLHEVATGGLSPQSVVEPIRKIMERSSDNLYQAEITRISFDKKEVRTSLGPIPYDYLVVALGATTNFYDVPGAEEHALVLKDLADAVRMRNRFIDAFETASKLAYGPRRAELLTFVIVGGGATGVELAAEMAELFLETFRNYYHREIGFGKEIAIHLIESGQALLPQFPPSLGIYALATLRKKGIVVHLNTSAKKVAKEGITLSNGETIRSPHVIWTAGVKPNMPAYSGDISLDPSGRIRVDDSFRIAGFPDAFAIGDIASLPDKTGEPIPMLAQAARQEGAALAENLLRAIQGKSPLPFRYRPKGSLVSLGQWRAVGSIRGIQISGPVAWYIWRTVYLFNFASWAKRLKIAVDWTVNLFDPRDIAKA